MVARLTRAQQQERTHARLLEAGRSVFGRRGFLVATVEEIAAKAGYTRGAVYKHFGGKEGLWQALTDARAAAQLQRLGTALDGVGSRDELVAALTPDKPADDDEATRWSVASAEFLAAVARHRKHAAVMAAAQRDHDEQIAALLARHCDRLGIRPMLPMPQVVVALGGLGGSLSLRHAVDPATDVVGVAAGVVAAMFPPPAKGRGSA